MSGRRAQATRGRKGRVVVAAAAVLGSFTGCHCTSIAKLDALFQEESDPDDASLLADDAAPAARCRVERTVTELTSEGAPVVIGDAVLVEGGAKVAFGAIRKSGGKETQSIGRVPIAGGAIAWADVELSVADDPPPGLATLGDSLYSFAYRHELRAGQSVRILALYRVQAAATRVFDLAPDLDESLAFDVAANDGKLVVAWDDLSDEGVRAGSILTSSFDPAAGEGSPLPLPRVLRRSPPGEVAFAPLLAGARLFYRARLAPDVAFPRDADAIEAPVEDDAPGWIESVTLEGDLAVTKLVPPSVHPLSLGVAGGVVVVGGALFSVDPSSLVRHPFAVQTSPAPVVPLGRFIFLEVGTDQPRAVSLATGTATDEPELRRARPLVALGAGRDAGDEARPRGAFLTVFEGELGSRLAEVVCLDATP